MNVDMPKNLTYAFCTTDGGTTIAVEKSRYAAESFNAELETECRARIGLDAWGDNNAWGDNKVDNKVDNNARSDNKADNNVGDDTVKDTVKHPQTRTRTTPVQHPYNETQFCTTTVPVQDPNEFVYLPARNRLNHRGPLSVDVSSAWYFIKICANGHTPWVADEVKIDRAVAPRPPISDVTVEELNVD